MSDYVIRYARTEHDFRYVIKSWLDTYRASKSSGLLSLTPHVEHCPTCNEEIDFGYVRVMGMLIERILRRPDVDVLVASNPREKPPLDLHGFIVVERNVQVPVYRPPLYKPEIEPTDAPLVHYVAVKKIYRRHGIAKALFKAAKIDPRAEYLYTCHTPGSVELERAGKMPRAKWNPLCARFEKKGTSQIHDEERHPPPVQQPRTGTDPK